MLSLLRTRGSDHSGKVTMVELFFDLVFVFAITQISHSLLANLTLDGALKHFLLLLAVWWVWIYTSWVTNWLDPDRLPVRLCLFALMLAGLLMSVSIPDAFGERGLLFASAYVCMQVGRTAFFLYAIRNSARNFVRSFQRIFIWLCLSAIFWIAGGLAEGPTRFLFWCFAFFIEFISPAALFWVPGLGRGSTTDWDVEGNHMAERCALFVIIALGESLLVTGATFADQQWDEKVIAAFLVAVTGSIALWWIYFDSGLERAHHRILRSSDPGSQARLAYTYMHAPIVAGVIVCAVADELVLVHPGHASAAGIAAIFGGPALYLLGCMLFKWVTNDRRAPPLSHLIGILLLIVLVPITSLLHWSALAMSAVTTAVLITVAVWEHCSLRKEVYGAH